MQRPPRFFLESPDKLKGENAVIESADAIHIAKSLRMKRGDIITLCDLRGFDYKAVLMEISAGVVTARILEKSPSGNEPLVKLRLYQALPKSDKLEWIVQKATELGVESIVPVLTGRCVSRPDAKSMEKKRLRLQKIALEAAKQSERGIIPEILPLLTFQEAVRDMKGWELPLFFYENADIPLRERLGGAFRSAALLIGSEGGFSAEEAGYAAEQGLLAAGLGPRILRCETAPLCAISSILYASGEY